MQPDRKTISTNEERIIGFVFILALVHGLIYVFLMPPWQHYDEPNHFEYVWLATHLDRLPRPDDYNPELSRNVLASMIANGFYDHLNFKPDLGSASQPVKIPGYSQLSDPPLYYLIASLPLRILRNGSVESQMYAARLVSLLLYLFTILAAWEISRELTPEGHLLRWMVPLTLALLPGFTDLMTAVNGDAGAVAVFSLFLWGSVRLIRRKFSVLNLLWGVGAAILTYFTKNTAMIALLVLPVVVLLAIFRGKLRFLAWSLLGVGVIASLALSISWGDARHWFRSTSQAEATRVASDKAVVGNYIFRLDTQAEVTPEWLAPLFQPQTPEAGQFLKGKVVTLGFWVWASQPVKITSPSVNTPGGSFSQLLQVSDTPKFYAFQLTMPEDASRAWIALAPRLPKNTPVQVYYDGLVLAEGARPVEEPPSFSRPDGWFGEWGGRPFVNFINNASAEKGGPRLSAWVDNLGARFLADNTRPSLILASFVDWRSTGFLYRLSIDRLFQTFWADFGWAHILLIFNQAYRILCIISLLGLLGCAIGLLRRFRQLPWDILVIFGWSLLLSWGSTFVRGAVYLSISKLFLPVARYAYPVIIITVLILVFGWLEGMNLVEIGWRKLTNWSPGRLGLFYSKHPNFLPRLLMGLYWSFFLALDILSIVSIAQFYRKL